MYIHFKRAHFVDFTTYPKTTYMQFSEQQCYVRYILIPCIDKVGPFEMDAHMIVFWIPTQNHKTSLENKEETFSWKKRFFNKIIYIFLTISAQF